MKGCSSYAARARSRPTITLSATDGQPPNPSSAETAPSWTWPSRVSVGSSQWTATGRAAAELYWSARRSSPGETTGCPSSEKPTAPRLGELDHLGELLALCSLETAAKKPTGISASVFARSTSDPRTAAESTTGLVLAMARSAQYPRRQRPRSRGDVLLVLAARRPQVHVRVDEGRREHRSLRPGRLDGR